MMSLESLCSFQKGLIYSCYIVATNPCVTVYYENKNHLQAHEVKEKKSVLYATLSVILAKTQQQPHSEYGQTLSDSVAPKRGHKASVNQPLSV